MRRTSTTMSEKTSITTTPKMNVGTARAKEGPTRSAISRLMLRPASERPRSPANSGAERVKKTVCVTLSIPCAASL